MTNARPEKKKNVSSTFPQRKYWLQLRKQRPTGPKRIHFTLSNCCEYELVVVIPTHYVHARYSSRMTDRFRNWGDRGKPKSGKIKGRCQPPRPWFWQFNFDSRRFRYAKDAHFLFHACILWYSNPSAHKWYQMCECISWLCNFMPFLFYFIFIYYYLLLFCHTE